MESAQEGFGMIPLQQYPVDHFGLIDFMDETHFDQFIDLVRGENEIGVTDQPINFFAHQAYDCDYQLNNGGGVYGTVDGHFFQPAELFDFNNIPASHNNIVSDNNLDLGLQNACRLTNVYEEEMVVEEDSSAATTTTTTTDIPAKTNGNKVDRSRTLVSERKRRGSMKEKLYALRALVPNITKMDKASIVGDAVSYVQDLQRQAKKLKAEIACLDSSLAGGDKNQGRTPQNANKMNHVMTNFYPMSKMISKMDVFQVEERGFYVRIVTNKGRGVTASLYKALETFTSFNVQSSNLTASPENYVIAFTLRIMEPEVDTSLPNLKLWIGAIFLNQGFEFETTQSA